MRRVQPDVALVLEAPLRIADGLGGQVTQWVARGQLWGAMDAGSGREARGEAGAASVVAWRITVRAAPPGDPRRPRPGERLRLGPRIFRIEAVAEDGPRGRWLVCHAKEEGGA
ncbi:head-tail adaptor protein [Paracoccus sp. S-4012]|uniref:head-tail adaptor protein n=1 Tax=Paracoccus sp. S-4012 TaxID=2665648 RepID=UPI0012AF697E|nr:head-tail adaptor protein [Paracoccus sp. S-4012]MRX50685.1 head-tail adaptor protein [Paracoccus sp. S-4012]